MWARLANIVLGLWVMAAPAVLTYGDPARTNDRIIGPIIVTFATVAIWETTRQVRRVNSILGLWLVAAPWILGYPGTLIIINSMITGLLILAFSLIEGKREKRVGGGWSVLWQ